MTLNETLLQKLASWRPSGARQTLAEDDSANGWRVEVTADCVDTLACRLWEVALRRTVSPAASAPLREQGEAIAERVTGLLEPLRLIEVDAEQGVALLRSESPAQREHAVAYYEVLRHSDGTTRLCRYHASQAGGKREQVAFTLTHEALAKLVGDLAG